jgi:hypothetical protein
VSRSNLNEVRTLPKPAWDPPSQGGSGPLPGGSQTGSPSRSNLNEVRTLPKPAWDPPRGVKYDLFWDPPFGPFGTWGACRLNRPVYWAYSAIGAKRGSKTGQNRPILGHFRPKYAISRHPHAWEAKKGHFGSF